MVVQASSRCADRLPPIRITLQIKQHAWFLRNLPEELRVRSVGAPFVRAGWASEGGGFWWQRWGGSATGVQAGVQAEGGQLNAAAGCTVLMLVGMP